MAKEIENDNGNLGEAIADLQESNKEVAEAVENVAEAVEESGKENTLRLKEEETEKRLFFKDLIGNMSNTLKSIVGHEGGVGGILGKLAGGFFIFGTGFIAKIAGFFKGLFALPAMVGLSKFLKWVFGPFWHIIKAFRPILMPFTAALGILGQIFKRVIWPITVVWGIIRSVTEAVKQYKEQGTLLSAVGGFIEGFLEFFTFGLYEADLTVGENLKKIGESILGWIRTSGQTLLDWLIVDVPDAIKNFGDDLAFFFKYDLKILLYNLWDGLLSFIKGEGGTEFSRELFVFIVDLASAIGDVLSAIGSGLWAMTKGLGSFLGETIMDFGYWLAETLSRLQYNVLRWVNSKFDWAVGDEFLEDMRQGVISIEEMRAQRKVNLAKQREIDREAAEAELEKIRAQRAAASADRRRTRDAQRTAFGAPTPSPTGVNLREQQAASEHGTSARSGATTVNNSPNVNTIVNNETHTHSQPPIETRDRFNPALWAIA